MFYLLTFFRAIIKSHINQVSTQFLKVQFRARRKCCVLFAALAKPGLTAFLRQPCSCEIGEHSLEAVEDALL